MTEHSFSQEDKDKLVSFLNFVAKHATFSVNTHGVIEYYKLLNHMQTKLIPKVDSHILEVIKVVEADDTTS